MFIRSPVWTSGHVHFLMGLSHAAGSVRAHTTWGHTLVSLGRVLVSLGCVCSFLLGVCSFLLGACACFSWVCCVRAFSPTVQPLWAPGVSHWSMHWAVPASSALLCRHQYRPHLDAGSLGSLLTHPHPTCCLLSWVTDFILFLRPHCFCVCRGWAVTALPPARLHGDRGSPWPGPVDTETEGQVST